MSIRPNDTSIWPKPANRPIFVDLAREMQPDQETVAYALTYVKVPRDTEAVVSLGTDDGCVLWVNDEELLRAPDPRPPAPGQNKVPVTFRKGWNKILLKVGQVGGGWGFYLQLLDSEGAPLSGVEVSPFPRE